MNRKKIKKIGNIAANVLLYLFLTVAILSVFFTVFSKRDPDGAANVLGYQMRIVTSDSMGECDMTDVSGYEIKSIPIRSMVFIKTMPDDPAEADEWYRSLQVGDVLTFKYVYTSQVTITHRIVSITEKDTGGFIISLEGDNKASESGQLYQTIDTSIENNTNYVIGKVTGHAYVFGVIMSFLTKPVGMVFVVIFPCAMIILFEVVKIIRTLSADKHERDKAVNDKQANEIEELRRKLAELEKANEAKEKTQEPEATEQASDDGNNTEATVEEENKE